MRRKAGSSPPRSSTTTSTSSARTTSSGSTVTRSSERPRSLAGSRTAARCTTSVARAALASTSPRVAMAFATAAPTVPTPRSPILTRFTVPLYLRAHLTTSPAASRLRCTPVPSLAKGPLPSGAPPSRPVPPNGDLRRCPDREAARDQTRRARLAARSAGRIRPDAGAVARVGIGRLEAHLADGPGGALRLLPGGPGRAVRPGQARPRPARRDLGGVAPHLERVLHRSVAGARPVGRPRRGDGGRQDHLHQRVLGGAPFRGKAARAVASAQVVAGLASGGVIRYSKRLDWDLQENALARAIAA